MSDFFAILLDSDTPFLLYALGVGVLSSISFGTIGTFVVTKRIGYIAGAISHCILGGIGAGFYFSWLSPIMGAYISAVISALILGFVNIYFKEREDTVISALWSLGAAIGLILIAKSGSYADPMSYLFGNILLVEKETLWTIIVLNTIVIGFCSLFYHKLLAICFDEEFARIRGVNVNAFHLLLLILISLTIVTLVNVVGIILVMALLTLPAALANHIFKEFGRIILASILICTIFNILGIAVSFHLNTASGPTIIILLVLAYFASLFIQFSLKNSRILRCYLSELKLMIRVKK
jgi:zinc transport system permease protein